MIDPEETKREKARQLRYKKPLVKDINLWAIREELEEISTECDNVRYYCDGDDETLINALDGNDEEAFEFKMMFAQLCAECEKMFYDLENEYVPEYFDIFFVATGAGQYGGGYLGYDEYEDDYFGLDVPDAFFKGESSKKLKRMTKDQLIDCAAVCLKVLYSYLGLRYRYDCLKATFDILHDKNTGYLQIVRKIEEVYEKADEEDFREWNPATRELNRMLAALPQEAWIQ